MDREVPRDGLSETRFGRLSQLGADQIGLATGRSATCPQQQDSDSLAVVSSDIVSHMTLTSILAALAGVAALVAGIREIARQFTDRRRAHLKHDLDCLALMPETVDFRQTWIEHVERSINTLLTRETELRRDPNGIVLALSFLGGAVAAMIAVLNGGSSFLWILVTVLGLFGAVGLGQDAVPRRRDTRGRPI